MWFAALGAIARPSVAYDSRKLAINYIATYAYFY